MDFFYRSPLFAPFRKQILPLFRHLQPKKPGITPAICPYQTGGSMKILKKLTQNQKGQGVMEYVIISSLVGIVCITAVKGFGDVIKERVEDMKKSIVENIKNK